MGGCCSSCICMGCIMDSYLHVYISDVKGITASSDISIGNKNDFTMRIEYDGYIQDSKILKNESKSAVFGEPLILENAKPKDDEKDCKLTVTLMDYDMATGDDILGVAVIPLPTQYAKNFGGDFPFMKDGNKIGSVQIDQIHFIKQKLRRYTGPCKACCCCLYTGTKG